MKKFIGFLLVVIFCVLFSGLSFGADEATTAVAASDIWFPSGITKWNYQENYFHPPDEPDHYVDVWVENENKNGIYYSVLRASSIFLTYPGSGPFDTFRIDNQGNIISLGKGFQNYLESAIYSSLLARNSGLSVDKMMELAGTVGFSSDEWLLLPTQLKDGKWVAVSYEFLNEKGEKERHDIRGSFKNNVLPSPKSEELLGTRNGFCRIDYEITGLKKFESEIFSTFIFFPGIGLVEKHEAGIIPYQLIEFQKAQPVEPKGKMATTWGGIKSKK